MSEIITQENFLELLKKATVVIVPDAREVDIADIAAEFAKDHEDEEPCGEPLDEGLNDKYVLTRDAVATIIEKICDTDYINVKAYHKTRQFQRDYELTDEDVQLIVKQLKVSDYSYSMPSSNIYHIGHTLDVFISGKDFYITNNRLLHEVVLYIKLDLTDEGVICAVSVHPSNREPEHPYTEALNDGDIMKDLNTAELLYLNFLGTKYDDVDIEVEDGKYILYLESDGKVVADNIEFPSFNSLRDYVNEKLNEERPDYTTLSITALKKLIKNARIGKTEDNVLCVVVPFEDDDLIAECTLDGDKIVCDIKSNSTEEKFDSFEIVDVPFDLIDDSVRLGVHRFVNEHELLDEAMSINSNYVDIQDFFKLAQDCGLRTLGDLEDFAKRHDVKEDDSLFLALYNYFVTEVKEPITGALMEGKMKELDIEIKNAGSNEEYVKVCQDKINSLKQYLNYLNTTAYRDINRGGNFDSAEEIEEAIEETQKELQDLTAKMDYVKTLIR